ncbi:hypothetical protein Fcan01_06211 [Folsomia candida]|uniref:Uncharacterized protein n=1 Tax=Folsomia candida TaxID=158441 RepID=A0A226ER54_FOLCA|nr:hypothetical protein Fcan01_06211 [Folsomia candida]
MPLFVGTPPTPPTTSPQLRRDEWEWERLITTKGEGERTVCEVEQGTGVEFKVVEIELENNTQVTTRPKTLSLKIITPPPLLLHPPPPPPKNTKQTLLEEEGDMSESHDE